MENNVFHAAQNAGHQERRITAFSATRQNYGLQIKVSGCVMLRPAVSPRENVIGIVELDDQIVPILDSRENPEGEITETCCIVLFENTIGQTVIVTGRLFESACQVFDLIVEYMDAPTEDEILYSPSRQRVVSDAAAQTQV